MYERTKKRKNNEGTSERKNERMSKRTKQGTNKSLFSAAGMIPKRLEYACATSKKQRHCDHVRKA